MSGQAANCAASSTGTATPAELALAGGDLAQAEKLFQQELQTQPQDARLIAGMVRTQLRLGKQDEAAAMVRAALQTSKPSAPLQVALADVQLKEGQPWLARESLDRAVEIDGCSAQAWLLRSRIARLDSMHATERADITRAHQIDPDDPEVQRAWNGIVKPAQDTLATVDYLQTTKNIDPELKAAAEKTVATTLTILSESTQTCSGPPVASAVTLPLEPSLQDPRHIDGYELAATFGGAKASLRLDTAASGLYITQKTAEANHLVHQPGDPANTVRAETVQVGPLTFHDCLVGVTEASFPNKASGMIGTDMFAQYLITLNFPESKLLLRPLPKNGSFIPGDRPESPELTGYSPVYHRHQFLMMPVTINGKERRLFVLDSGIRLSAMTLPVAHLVSSTRHGLTSSVKTTSGATIQTYNDSFDLEFAHQQVHSPAGMLELDPASIEQNTGMKIGGLLGLDILQTAVLSMDYRDGLALVDFPAGSPAAPAVKLSAAKLEVAKATESTTCTRRLPPEVPRGYAITASNTGMLDVHQLKNGQVFSLRVERPWETDGCHLERAALLHGHVVKVDRGGDPKPASLELVIDHAECFGKREQVMPLRLVSIIGNSGPAYNVDQTLPSAIVSGRGRQIQDSVSSTMNIDEVDRDPEAKQKAVKVGSVRGMPDVKLDTAGPACSAVLTGSGSALRLGAGTRWLLVSEH